MIEDIRYGFDGTLEPISFQTKLAIKPDPDPFDGSVVRMIERATMDGVEYVPMRVITSTLTRDEVNDGIIFAAEKIIKEHQKGKK